MRLVETCSCRDCVVMGCPPCDKSVSGLPSWPGEPLGSPSSPSPPAVLISASESSSYKVCFIDPPRSSLLRFVWRAVVPYHKAEVSVPYRCFHSHDQLQLLAKRFNHALYLPSLLRIFEGPHLPASSPQSRTACLQTSLGELCFFFLTREEIAQEYGKYYKTMHKYSQFGFGKQRWWFLSGRKQGSWCRRRFIAVSFAINQPVDSVAGMNSIGFPLGRVELHLKGRHVKS